MGRFEKAKRVQLLYTRQVHLGSDANDNDSVFFQNRFRIKSLQQGMLKH
jgi:hypothetical protein